jgi:uncharacterized protein YjbJ (UPF0337 family)
MTDSTQDKIQGVIHETKGAIKEKVGQLTKDPDLEAEGTGEKVGGKILQKVGDIKKVFEK